MYLLSYTSIRCRETYQDLNKSKLVIIDNEWIITGDNNAGHW